MMLARFQKADPFYINPNPVRQNMAERGAGEKLSQECWSVTTRAEKVLLFLLILTLLILIGISVFIIDHFLFERNCDTPECIEASYKLIKTIDFNSSPCEDFHQFVCGNYIPLEEHKIDVITSKPNEKDSPLLSNVKLFYQTCINETAIEEDDETTLAALVSQIGEWPILRGNKWNEESFNWLNFMVQVRPLGVKSDWLLHFEYYEDENATNLLLIEPPQLMPTSVQFKTEYYQEIIGILAVKLDGDEFMQNQLTQMMQFEDNLYRISKRARKEMAENGDYSKVLVSKMNEIWPENLLVEVLNGLARGYSVFTNSTLVVIASENYLYELHKLLTSVPKRTQANYFVWKTIEALIPYLSSDVRETYSKYVELPSREEHCHLETVRRFHSVIESEYVEKHKSPKTEPLLKTIVSLTYQSYNQSTDATAEVVIEGPEGQHTGVTNIQFQSPRIIRMINEIQFHIENEFYRCLHNKSDCLKEDYYENTEQKDVYFDTFDNTIHLPYNLIYSSYFMWNQPNYINFAKMGRIIGDKMVEAEAEKYNTSISIKGVNIAYEAYNKWLQTHGMERNLPVLEFNIRQLFWLYSSILYCSKDDLEKFEEVAESLYFQSDFRCQ